MHWATFLPKVAFFAPAMHGADGVGELGSLPGLACWPGCQRWECCAWLGKTLKGGMEPGCLQDRPTLCILFFWPSPSARFPHNVAPPWQEDMYLSGPSTGRPLVDICLKNPKD